MALRETRHATARRQGRGVPAFVVNLLLEQGACTRYDGADVFRVDKAARCRIRRTLGDRIHAAFESFLYAYVVLGDNGRAAAAWRTRRQRRAAAASPSSARAPASSSAPPHFIREAGRSRAAGRSRWVAGVKPATGQDP